jgi:hypothetical protein
MPDKIPRFLQTNIDGMNEWVPNVSIPYGSYLLNILRYYHGFSDDLNLLILKLMLAWVMHAANDNLVAAEVESLLENITGQSLANGYAVDIRLIENELSMFLSDMTGISAPVIFDGTYTDVTMSYQ